ncbi:MAG: GIY-YIG nuclease family protein [Balneolaceae bacterium]
MSQKTSRVCLPPSEKYDKIYIGCTSNLAKRFKSHNELGTKGWTVNFRPWKIVHTEGFATRSEASKREKQLKSAAGRRWIWKELIGE